MFKLAVASVIFGLAMPVIVTAQTSAKAVYDELCASCHRQPKRLAARLERTPEARTKLDAFLVTHHAQDAQKRVAVIDYLYAAK